jgi:hypothetical protein
MQWWASNELKKDDGVLRHPSDAQQWKHFDDKYLWLVILSIYNLPPWLCQKRKYLLLTIIISGPKEPGIGMDVFLEPLMQEMETLWKHGVKMWDELAKSTFTCKAIIFVTIIDYPG